ncbi:hypothetical protein DOTSEDRAFT_154934 [Dothistroma septosporum NZE10]|uniref:Tryptophan synthase beta chain-like PALP domain-containing protein n=1 Tax=Dothistroma septosporum (strain NZE10 / CBS 128990) TaxID=675120 RepID=N1PIR6_DOTSN|nr:hypothetical protein DOTSEDRAFT_154934 [Dothistroma septosporum NZE10]
MMAQQQYQIKHLKSGKEVQRDFVFINSSEATSSWSHPAVVDAAVEAFHQELPDYNVTPLHSLPTVAAELGIGQLFLKDESNRFGLPAFKILGASWAIFKSVCRELNLPLTSSMEEVRRAITSMKDLQVVTCTEGNWGRACARMGKLLDLPIVIYVPGFMTEYTQRLIESEGAQVVRLPNGSYDDSIQKARTVSEETGALLVMDISWDGYQEVPHWVTQGYSTMLAETDRQIQTAQGGQSPSQNSVYITSVGVGSWAHSVVAHYKAASSSAFITTVEPEVAASLKESLHCKEITPVATGDTIMAGMNCGTTSKIAWPTLREGVGAAVAVNDVEAHQSVLELKAQGVKPGPCGAATLAALRKYLKEAGDSRDWSKSTVVLFSTEGEREYAVPQG